jgi:hypothetical protein
MVERRLSQIVSGVLVLLFLQATCCVCAAEDPWTVPGDGDAYAFGWIPSPADNPHLKADQEVRAQALEPQYDLRDYGRDATEPAGHSPPTHRSNRPDYRSSVPGITRRRTWPTYPGLT